VSSPTGAVTLPKPESTGLLLSAISPSPSVDGSQSPRTVPIPSSLSRLPTPNPDTNGPVSSSLLLRPQPSQASLMSAKRKSDLDHIRKILSSTTRSALEQKFKDELIKKKLLGCFGNKKGGDELRRRALSLMKTAPDGGAKVSSRGSLIQATYAVPSMVHLSPPHSSVRQTSPSHEIRLIFSSPSTPHVMSQLFARGADYSLRGFGQVCDLYSSGYDLLTSSHGSSADSVMNGQEYVACFDRTKTSSQQRRRWYPSPLSPGGACRCCHLSASHVACETYLKVSCHSQDSTLYSLSAILPTAPIPIPHPERRDRERGSTDSSHHSKVQLTLQQIATNLFISSMSREVNCSLHTTDEKKRNEETSPSEEETASSLSPGAGAASPTWQKYLENWILFVSENPQDPLVPDVDLLVT
jgi:hypothetical protein